LQAVLFVVILLGCSVQTDSGNKQHSNIIFLLTDDQRWDAMGVLENTIIKTLNMDFLANSGVFYQRTRYHINLLLQPSQHIIPSIRFRAWY